ncbi:MAG: hypothetical protein HY861_03870 [Chlamydiia bacterium]|nr:hypothetical protein [Chlamydiia bacterium]
MIEKSTNESVLWQVVGPIALIAAFAMAPIGVASVPLKMTSCLGLFLSARWQMRGCFAALLTLFVAGTLSHVLADGHHLWRLCLEFSSALSFVITALSFTQIGQDLSSLASQTQAQQAAIRNLEEEMASIHANATERQIVSTAKIEELQKRIEEVESEKASLEILNDVLRKTNAGYYVEKKALEESFSQEKQRLAQLVLVAEEQRQEIAVLQQISATTANNDLLHQEREALMEQLTQAEEKIRSLALLESKHRQLKEQFEEKNKVLQETRALLFHSDTALQSFQIEKAQKELRFDPLFEALSKELSVQEQETSHLQEENKELECLVTCLTHLAGQPSLEEILRESLVPKRKKKTKKPAQQDLLF